MHLSCRTALGFIVASSPIKAHAQAKAPNAGWSLTIRISTEFGNGGTGNVTTMRHRMTDHAIRWEVTRVSSATGPVSASGPFDGAYTIVDVADSTMTSVTPATHRATVMSLDPLPDARRAMLPKMVEHLTRSQLDDLGDGGTILGHATRHYRLTTEGTADFTVAGQTCSRRIDAVSEMWIARDVDFGPIADQLVAPIGGSRRVTAAVVNDGVPRAAAPKGTPLRTITRENGGGGTGPAIATTTTVEITELSRAPLDASIFSVPTGIETVDLRERMRRLPAGLVDSVVRATNANISSNATRALCNGRGNSRPPLE
jgi:hypothetical protein